MRSLSHRLVALDPRLRGADFLVSHGYMHRVPARVIERFRQRAVNLHNGLLPHTRGLDAVTWSFVEGTPTGATVHFMDEGLDTGPIIAQREVVVGDEKTLREAWWQVETELVSLFKEQWPAIREGRSPSLPQPAGGSNHSKADADAIAHLLTRGWDTPVGELRAGGRDEDALPRE